MITCIYKIFNPINNRIYIGSAINFSNRKAKHLRQLRVGRLNTKTFKMKKTKDLKVKASEKQNTKPDGYTLLGEVIGRF